MNALTATVDPAHVPADPILVLEEWITDRALTNALDALRMWATDPEFARDVALSILTDADRRIEALRRHP